MDGLRALAVIAVVLFHLNPDYLSGGFLGVDLFFVISGYLITRLLLAERGRTGRIALGRFYLRRARRLLPAVGALLAVVFAAAWLLWPDQRPTLPGSVLSSAGYVTNWWLIADSQSYFASMGRPPMLQHLWSLAIEEQYYLLWAPIVIVVTSTWFAKRYLRSRAPGAAAPETRAAMAVAIVAAALAVASTLAMTAIAIVTNIPYEADSSRVYFGTDTHAMGLLLGSAVGALAVIPWRQVLAKRRWATALMGAGGRPIGRARGIWATDLVAIAGIAVVLWFFTNVDEFVPWLYLGGFLAFAAVAVAVVMCAARPGSRIGRLLDFRPLRWIGQRSYGIYLWHWPVIVVTRPGIDVHGPAWLIDLARAGLAVGLAALSYRYLEAPVRRGDFVASVRRALSRWAPKPSAPLRGAAAAPRPWAHRHWPLPAAIAACAALLLVAHVTTLQEPAWADAVPSAALPVPGEPVQLPGGVNNGAGADAPATSHDATAVTSSVIQILPSRTAAAPPIIPTNEPTAARPPATSAASGAPASITPASIATPDAAASTTPSPVVSAPPISTPASTSAPTSKPVSKPAPPASKPATPSKPAPPAKPPAKVGAVSAFGDSVLLGAAKAVQATVGSMTVDAVVGRQAWDTLGDVAAAQQAKSLAPVVLIHTGNNGVISPKQLASTLAALADRTRVVVVNDHVDRPWQGPNNTTIAAMAGKYPNVVIVDWNAVASKNPGWFGPDGIHVNGSGAKGYAALVAAAMG